MSRPSLSFSHAASLSHSPSLMSSHGTVRTTTTTKVTHARTILQNVTECTHLHTTSSTPKLQMNNNEVILTLSHANMLSLSRRRSSRRKSSPAAAAKFRSGSWSGPSQARGCPCRHWRRGDEYDDVIGGLSLSQKLPALQKLFRRTLPKLAHPNRTIGRLRVKAPSLSLSVSFSFSHFPNHIPESSLAVFSVRSFLGAAYVKPSPKCVRGWLAAAF